MGTTSQKLTYLNDTKQGLKTVINYTGANIINTTTFREYVEKLYSGYIDTLNNPKTLFNNMPHITGTGIGLTLNNTAECKMAIELEPSELSQTTTIGKNIFKASNSIWSGSSAGKVNYDSTTDLFTFHRDSGADYLINYGTLNLEPNTNYTLYLDVKENTMTNVFSIIASGFLYKSGGNELLLAGATGVHTFQLTTSANAKTYDLWLYCINYLWYNY